MKINRACLACCTILYPLACPANAEVQWEIVNQGETSDKPIIWEEVPETENTHQSLMSLNGHTSKNQTANISIRSIDQAIQAGQRL